jgi:hypothetical protein
MSVQLSPYCLLLHDFADAVEFYEETDTHGFTTFSILFITS